MNAFMCHEYAPCVIRITALNETYMSMLLSEKLLIGNFEVHALCFLLISKPFTTMNTICQLIIMCYVHNKYHLCNLPELHNYV